MSKRKKVYLEYLKGNHWKALRLEALQRDNYTCQGCGVQRQVLDVHHLVYRNPLESCTIFDLQSLCIGCHGDIHRKKGKNKNVRKPKAPREGNDHRIDQWIQESSNKIRGVRRELERRLCKLMPVEQAIEIAQKCGGT